MENFSKISSLILLSILVISIIVNIKNFTKIDKDKYIELETINKNIQKSRDSLIRVNKNLKWDFKSLQDSINKRDLTILRLNDKLLKSDKDLNFYKTRVSILESDKRNIEKKIDEIKKNPIIRSDDELIKSLKNKLKS